MLDSTASLFGIIFCAYLHTLPETELKSRFAELAAFADDFPDEERNVGRHQYCDLTELAGNPRPALAFGAQRLPQLLR